MQEAIRVNPHIGIRPVVWSRTTTAGSHLPGVVRELDGFGCSSGRWPYKGRDRVCRNTPIGRIERQQHETNEECDNNNVPVVHMSSARTRGDVFGWFRVCQR